MSLARRSVVESIGTFWLVLGGCGSAVLSTSGAGSIGYAGVALAFGLTVLTMAYAIGCISGCHLNPAVTVGLWSAGRFPGREIPAYVAAQVIGAIVAAFFLWAVASGIDGGYDLAARGLAQNGYGAHSPHHYDLLSGLLIEVVLTFVFVFVICGVTVREGFEGFSPIAIGFTLTLIHLISIPVTNTSVNPARSTGPALVVGGDALAQLWLFWAAPLVGAVLAGLVARSLLGRPDEVPA